MKFPLPDSSGVERFKRQEKEKVEKPLERPVEPLDHDDKRRKFQEAVKQPLTPIKKEVIRKEPEAKDLHPSLFQLARSTRLDDKVGDALDKDEKEEKKSSSQEDELVVARNNASTPFQTTSYYTQYMKQDLVEAVSSKEERPLYVNQNEVIEVIEQMIKALVVVEKSDVTETRVTLREPPLFEGVTFTVQEHATSQREFSITFENLTNPDARALIEQPHTEALLRAQLLDKGYVLQMVTIEPKLEYTIAEVQETDLQDRHRGKEQQDPRDSRQK